MRVTHVFHSYSPVVGGMERAIQRLAQEQAKIGHDVHVVTSFIGADGEPEEEMVDGIHIHRVKSMTLHFPDLTLPMVHPEGALERSNLVHVHSQNSAFCVSVAKQAKRAGKPIVMNFLAIDYLRSHPNVLVKTLGGCYQSWIQDVASRLADAPVALNERDRDTLKEKYGLESEVVPHGIDEQYLTKPRNESLFRRKYGIFSRNVVTYVGRIHPSKGLDILVRAAALVAREVNDFSVVISGAGPESYATELGHLAKKLGVEQNIRIIGYASEDEKLSLLDSSKAFVLPSRHFGEAYPLVVDEAFARKVPVVATRVGALPYRVKHLETGILVPPEDQHSLGRAILTLLKEGDLYAAIKKELENSMSLSSWSKVCLRLEKTYSDVLDGRKS